MNSKIGVCYWNVAGFWKETTGPFDGNPDFLSKISQYEKIALSETHQGPTDNISIPGYIPTPANRKKHKKLKFIPGV